MARKTKLVTRTITTTKCTVMCANTETGVIENHDVTLPRTYKDEKALMKAVKAQIDSEELTAVKVIATETEETLYGMDELVFIENAKVLPPRTTKEQ